MPTASTSQRPSACLLASRISANVPTPAIASSWLVPSAGRDLAALADQHHAEGRGRVEAASDHHPVALLEHVEGERDAGRQDGVEREERDLHRPAGSLTETPPGVPAASGWGRERAGRWTPRALPARQCEQERGVPSPSAVRKLEPQPQPETAFGLLTVKPAPMRVST